MSDLTRSEAIAAIQSHLGDTEKTAHILDWTREMWETMDELEKQLGPQLAYQVINARRPPTFEELQ